MRVAFVNLPHAVPVIRRYMCSYNAPVFLYPPQELMYAATTVRDWGGHEVRVLDCIAERWDRAKMISELRAFAPDLVVTLLGFEILESDVKAVRDIRRELPGVKLLAFGHYATTFPREIMELAKLDFVIMGEPEIACHELVSALASKSSLSQIQGLCYVADDGKLVINPERPRLKPVDELPHPDYGLVNIDHYSEFLLPKPFATMQTARGCPYACNFCVRSYGKKLGLRTPANILDEIQKLVDRFGIRSIRFMDDTFTAIPERTIEICRGIEKNFPQLVWTCLSRIDTMDEARAKAMKAAGCKRVYLGVESGSDRILKMYGKEYGIDHVPVTIDLLRKHGFEIGCFFMVGHPLETPSDFEQTSKLIRKLDIDYATVGITVPYPGTELYDQYKDDIDFSLVPYRNEWKDTTRRRQLFAWEKRFFREMYFRPRYIARHVMRMIRHPGTTLRAGRALMPMILGQGVEADRRELF